MVVTADDPEMHSSQNEQDNRHYARAAKIPMLEPSDSAEALAFVKRGFEVSEEFDTPLMLRVTTRICHAQGIVELSERKDVPLRDYARNFEKNVMLPVNARKKHPLVEARTVALTKWAAQSGLNRIEKGQGSVGFVTSGVSYQYVREAFPDAPVLKYGMSFPLELSIARRFRKMVDKLFVVEEGDAYIEEQLQAAGIQVDGGKAKTGLLGELNVDRVRAAFGKKAGKGLTTEIPVPARPPALCAGCSHRGIYYALKQEKATVFGDIGCYTLAALPPLSIMDTCICMGASISASEGLVKARAGEERRMACTIGDSTFLHSGITGLIDTVHNQAAFVTVILDNRVTAMTGHQNNPNTGKNLRGQDTPPLDLEALVKACGVREVSVVDPYDLAATRAALVRHFELKEPSVIIVRRKCVEWSRERETPFRVDQELCTGCKTCVGLGCPAISFDSARRKSSIDETMCIGCTLCHQVCRFSAIYRTDKEAEHREDAARELKRRADRKAEAQKAAKNTGGKGGRS